MSPSFLVIGLVVIAVLWFVINQLYFKPAENALRNSLQQTLNKQAAKRGGKVQVVRGNPSLTVPYKAINIECRLIENSDELYREFTYAVFRIPDLTNKNVAVLRNYKELLLKPVQFGARVHIADGKFNEDYVVAGNDPDFIRNLLTQKIRDKLLSHSLQVKLGVRFDAPILNREKGWVSVFANGVKYGDEFFDVLIETTILIYDKLIELNGSAAGDHLKPA